MATILLVGPDRGAVGGVTTHLDLLYASVLAREHQYVHFCVGSVEPGESLLKKLLRVLAAPFAFAAALRHSKAALVHLNPSMDRSFWRELPLLLAARALRVPALVQLHGGELPEQFCAHVPGTSLLVRMVLGQADQIAVLGRAEQASFADMLGPGRLNLIPNAIDVRPYLGPKPPPYDGRRPLRAVYLGRIVRSKGLFEACDALRMAAAAGVRVELQIAGDGADSGALSQYIKESGLDAHVRLVGPIYGEAKAAFLLQADVFLFPTHFEGLPYALLETMAAATPAIATAVGAIPEVITDCIDGLIVPVGDPQACAAALTRLAGAPDLLRAMSRAARERACSAYALPRLERDFLGLYARMLGTNVPAFPGSLPAADALAQPDRGAPRLKEQR